MKLKIPALLKILALPIAVCFSAVLQLRALADFPQNQDRSLAVMMEPLMLGNRERIVSEEEDEEEEDEDEDEEFWLAGEVDDSFEVTAEFRTPYDPKYDNRTTWPFERANDVHAYFVHVGKAGGKSLYNKLSVEEIPRRARCRRFSKRINNPKCYGNNRKRNKMSAVARQILGHIHVHSPRYTRRDKEWLRNNTNLLLVTVRDPIDRIKSAFNYHHNNFFQRKKNIRSEGTSRLGLTIFVDCFKKVEDLARAVTTTSGTSNHCREIALALLEGRARYDPLPHFSCNYGYYLNRVQSDQPKAVAVLRTENQWEDLGRLESLLGGNPSRYLEPEKQVKYTHGSESFQLQSGISPEGAKALCCVLHGDIQVYHGLITSAVNLKGSEKDETLRSLLVHCGVNETLSNAQVWEWRWKSWHDESCHELQNSLARR